MIAETSSGRTPEARALERVTVSAAGARTPALLTRTFGWDGYVVAALTAQGQTVGLLHTDAGAARPIPDELDAEVTASYAEGLSGVLERAVLRHTLALHRVELQAAAQWVGARLGRLSVATGAESPRPAAAADLRLVQTLTPRELEVMQLLARGSTNRAITTALLVREGTVKYHVKNILRKLGARSRSDAVSRFVRAGWAGEEP